ncbi:thioesterase family protein [Pseudonocardia eucalypti]|uniref:Thioesterase family protein n=1 Tax=Pseudonocardia eucalypti TaxID=648755 RepID=A0ABP9Q663_9PSEU|nr:acyl-coenzyme A thioesterase PaaI-like protein [Pseudonocardia eucalypti]
MQPVSVTSAPFSGSLGLTPLGVGAHARSADAALGEYQADLDGQWDVGSGKLHGGYLLALVAKAAVTGLAADTDESLDPVAVSAEFLAAPDPGPARVRTQVLKRGRTVSVTRAELYQGDRLMLHSTVTAGKLLTGAEAPAPVWAELPEQPAEPPADAIATTDLDRTVPLAGACEVRLDRPTVGYLRRETGPPVIRGWARPHGEQPDVLFAVMASDILPPVLFNVSRPGWSPTVQLTALMRARPAPGWLRVITSSRQVAAGWFDEDCVILDATGTLICQSRQLALAPLNK